MQACVRNISRHGRRTWSWMMSEGQGESMLPRFPRSYWQRRIKTFRAGSPAVDLISETTEAVETEEGVQVA